MTYLNTQTVTEEEVDLLGFFHNHHLESHHTGSRAGFSKDVSHYLLAYSDMSFLLFFLK